MNPTLHIILDGDQCWPELVGRRVLDAGNEVYLAALPGGMSSGKTSITLRLTLSDGTTVLAQTSLALLNTATAAFNERYPNG